MLTVASSLPCDMTEKNAQWVFYSYKTGILFYDIGTQNVASRLGLYCLFNTRISLKKME